MLNSFKQLKRIKKKINIFVGLMDKVFTFGHFLLTITNMNDNFFSFKYLTDVHNILICTTKFKKS